MALPTWVKSGVSTVTFSRGDRFPRPLEGSEGQLVAESEAGTVRVATLHAVVRFYTMNFAGQTRLPTADYDAMRTFLLDPLVNLSANSFTWTDTDGTARTVRYMDGLSQFSPSSSGFYQGSILLREEL